MNHVQLELAQIDPVTLIITSQHVVIVEQGASLYPVKLNISVIKLAS